MNGNWKILLLFVFFATLSGCASLREGHEIPPLKAVPELDLQRYMGTWYEIARYPNRFQDSCDSDVVAKYSMLSDGKVQVINSCSEGAGRKIKESRGKAWVPDSAANAKLKVSFFWPFSGDYWVIDIGSSYEYAVVGTPSRRYLWILSREPGIDVKTYIEILQRLRLQGYDPNLLLEAHQ